ncbi:MAG: DUF4080 domain-containing protein [Desulfobulbaceae bacterium]|nr:DUF4080 domain-containing protein [Desulfobulbaceae bacterium]
MEIKLIALNARYTHSCPALFYVRNELEKHILAPDITLHQFTINDPYFSTLIRISDSRPDYLFFSVYIWNYNYVTRLVKDLARILPDTRIILGGPQITFMPDHDLPSGCTIVRGEIEGVEPSFYQDLMDDRLRSEYIAERGNHFPSPYKDKDFSRELKNRSVYYESSRGCPFSCTYCLSSVEKGFWCKDAGQVMEELGEILKHSPMIIRFVDRTFNADQNRALQIWQFLSTTKGDTTFHFEIAPDRFNEEMFSFLETMPDRRFQFEIGIQSTNPLTLSAINRVMDLKTALTNIRRLISLDNIHIHVDLILGLPHETQNTFRKSFNDLFSVFPHYIQMGLLKILPGTPIEQSMEEFEMVRCSQPPYQILATHRMNHETVSRLYWFGECVEAFFNNRFFRTFFDYVRRMEDDPFAFFNTLLKKCLASRFFEAARTQKLMTSLLFELVDKRPDRDLLQELLIFDWFRSGHRFLPDYFPSPPLGEIRNTLRKQLPQNLEPYFSYKTREEFLKKGVFIQFSGQALKETGLTHNENGGYVCFLPETSPGVQKLRRAVLIPGNGCITRLSGN